MFLISYIIWSPNPEIFPGISWFPPRWYGLLFALAFIVGQQIYLYMYKKESKPEKDMETLTIYLIIATLLGARLGHVFFYEPVRFLSDPLEILKIWKGGLASHGAAVGIILGIYIYCNYFVKIGFSEFTIRKRRKEGQSFLYVMDRLVIVVALGGAFIRTGNLINSEIIGKPTQSNLGVVFARDVIDRFEYDQYIESAAMKKNRSEVYRDQQNNNYHAVDLILTFTKEIQQKPLVERYIETHARYILTNYEYIKLHIYQPADDELQYDVSENRDGTFTAHIHTSGISRHPAQLYEAISSLILFFFLFWIWTKKKSNVPEGLIFGLFLIILFTLRFFYEFLKENQVEFENDMPLNMGQWLSIPLIIAGVFILIKSFKTANST